MTSCCCELSKLRNAGANRDRTSLPRGVRTALSPKQGGKVGEKVQPCPLNRRACLTPPLCVCYTLDKLLKCTPALQHVCCRPPCEGVGRNWFWPGFFLSFLGRPPCEGVDRNRAALARLRLSRLSPSTRRAWIEISAMRPTAAACACRPPREGVGRNHSPGLRNRFPTVSPSMRRAWVEIPWRQPT